MKTLLIFFLLFKSLLKPAVSITLKIFFFFYLSFYGISVEGHIPVIDTYSPFNEFIRVDFPQLVFPTKATENSDSNSLFLFEL